MKILGILNITPDSFSDGGKYYHIDEALAHAEEIINAGADIVDVGGESTRPGFEPLTLAEEQKRVLEVVKALSASGYKISIDTRNSETARKAVRLGASVINDVTGGRSDEKMLQTVAELQVPYIMGHWFGDLKVNNGINHEVVISGGDYIDNYITQLVEISQNALNAGIRPENIVLDVGIGFAKNNEQNWQILNNIARIKNLGYPIMLGVSRKRIMKNLLPDYFSGQDAQLLLTDTATAVISNWAAQQNLWAVRVHNVLHSATAIKVAKCLQAERTAVPFAVSNEATTQINITGLSVYGYHGLFEFENKQGQEFIIDLSIEILASNIHDDINQTINYADVISQVHNIVSGRPVNLIEYLAEKIAHKVLSFPKAISCEVHVHKPNAPVSQNFNDISVRIKRKKQELL